MKHDFWFANVQEMKRIFLHHRRFKFIVRLLYHLVTGFSGNRGTLQYFDSFTCSIIFHHSNDIICLRIYSALIKTPQWSFYNHLFKCIQPYFTPGQMSLFSKSFPSYLNTFPTCINKHRIKRFCIQNLVYFFRF